jgi:hypothetical protein
LIVKLKMLYTKILKNKINNKISKGNNKKNKIKNKNYLKKRIYLIVDK